MSFWNFAKGAADKLLADREAAGAEEREMEMWKKRAEFQAKIQADMEKAKEKNRILATGISTKTGKIETVRADGSVESVNAPESVLATQKATEQAALDKAAQAKAKLEAELMAKGASAASAKASAAASYAGIERGLAEQARRDRETNLKEEGGYFTRDTEGKAKKEADREINSIVTDITRLEDEDAKVRAVAIKNSGKDPEEIKADLRALLKLALQK